jgi:Leu/Phe-tRNA-protein transferase
MMIGMIQSEKVHLNGFGVYVVSRATYAQSHQRRGSAEEERMRE